MRNIIFIICFLLLASCRNNTYQKYHVFTNNQWHTDSILHYNYLILDTTKKYKLSFNIRHNINYEYENLFYLVSSSEEEKLKRKF